MQINVPQELIEQIPSFGTLVVDWNACLHGNVGIDKWSVTVTDAEEMLRSILEYFFTCCGTAVDFSPAEFFDFGNGIFVHSVDRLQDTELQLGMDEKGFYLKAGIACPENIALMSDDFWKEWLRLTGMGDLSFQVNEIPPQMVHEEKRALYDSENSNLFCFIRNLIFLLMENGEADGLGWLCMEWPFESWSVREVIEKGAMSADLISKLNAMLFRRK